MGSNSSAMAQAGNPVLNNFLGFPVQPYWFIIAQLVIIQLLQRLYNKYRCWGDENKKSIFLPLEILIFAGKAGIEPTSYSFADFILSLVSMAHFIYASYLQRKCTESSNQSSWNCYNAYGYRLFNYVLPSVVSVLVQSIVQFVNRLKHQKKPSYSKRGQAGFFWKWLLLGTTLLMNVVVCIVFIPFLITNALPMLVGFCWLLIPLWAVLIVVYAAFIYLLLMLIGRCTDFSFEGYRKRMFAAQCVVGLYAFGCLILSMAYNYSQYTYYAGGYIRVLGYEFQSRETGAYFTRLGNDSELVGHNVLAFF